MSAATRLPVVAVTAGEPAGIGPELCAMLAARHAGDALRARLVLVGNRALIAARGRRIGIDVDLPRYEANDDDARMSVLDIALAQPVTPGTLAVANAVHVRTMLESAVDGCLAGRFDAVVTAPAQKSVMLDAGIDFPGHTEFFAARARVPRVVMMLVDGVDARAAAEAGTAPLRVALVTTHLALADVPRAITREAVAETLVVVARDLRERFGIAAPRIAVCGLNPHAGEGGHLGREEIDVIAPAIGAARASGIDATGPWPADTIFVPSHARHHDAIVAMYHDQGLPVLKAASFGGGVNVTLGLPFVRTSVDHGTALDLARDAAKAAGADPGSLFAALELAVDLTQRQVTASQRPRVA